MSGAKQISSCLFKDPELEERLQKRLEHSRQVRNVEVELIDASGDISWAMLTMRNMEFEGQPSILIWVYDIT